MSWAVVELLVERSVHLISVKCSKQKCSVSNKKCEVFQKQQKCPGRSQSQARDSNERFRSVTTSGMEDCLLLVVLELKSKLLCLNFSSERFRTYESYKELYVVLKSKLCLLMRIIVTSTGWRRRLSFCSVV